MEENHKDNHEMWLQLYQVFMFTSDQPLQKDKNEVDSLVRLPLAA